MTTPWWGPNPQFIIDVGGTSYINDAAFTIEITRPENNISSCVMTLDDYKSSKYVDVFDTNTSFDLSLRYGSDTPTKVFSGRVFNAEPTISTAGEFLTISAWGHGYGLIKTHADTSWGVESQRHHALVTAQAIIQDIIANYVNNSLDGAPTNWGLISAVENVHPGCTFTYLNSNYLDCFSVLNRVCDIVNAWARTQGVPEPGIHWFCDPDKNVRVKEIDGSSTDGDWPRYWNNALTTITVKQEMILYDFRKTMDEYTNDVLLSSAFRLPAEDYWTEGHGADWGHSANIAHADDADPCIVGATSLQWTPSDDAVAEIWYPSAPTAAWNLSVIGSQKNPPLLSFYARQTNANFTPAIRFYTAAGNYFTTYGSLSMPDVDRWYHFTLPLGDYHEIHIDDYRTRWVIGAGAPSWSNINWLYMALGGLCQAQSFWLDDLHFSGNIVRRAYDSDAWATYYDQQKTILNNTAISDVLFATTDSGTAARLACAELQRGMSTPIVGVIQIPMAVNILPGQQLHIHACEQSDGTYRIDKDSSNNDKIWRVKELKHTINNQGFYTTLNLTDDVNNSRAIGAPTIATLLQEYLGALGHAEAKDLKGGVMDNLIPRLEKNY